jgi:hypothetical protein
MLDELSRIGQPPSPPADAAYASHQPPAMGREQQEEMLQFLLSLEAMKQTDPKAYADTMASMGLGQGQGQGPGAAEDQLKALTQSIMSMRTQDGSATGSPNAARIDLPSGKSHLGASGVESKVSLPLHCITSLHRAAIHLPACALNAARLPLLIL